GRRPRAVGAPRGRDGRGPHVATPRRRRRVLRSAIAPRRRLRRNTMARMRRTFLRARLVSARLVSLASGALILVGEGGAGSPEPPGGSAGTTGGGGDSGGGRGGI